jgi:hypothetical protein
MIRRLVSVVLVTAFLASCSIVTTCFSSFFTTESSHDQWQEKLWGELLPAAKKVRGVNREVSSALTEIIKKKMERAPVFAEKKGREVGDETFLLSPRNSLIRPSRWDRSFIYKGAEKGYGYVFHLFCEGEEVYSKPVEKERRVVIDETAYRFQTGIEYTWDVTLCVELCGLHLSATPFHRPAFRLLTEDEERVVSDWLRGVERWENDLVSVDAVEKVALTALILEHFGLYMEEEELLLEKITDNPDSALLHLVLSGVYELMGFSTRATDAYDTARELSGYAHEIAP